VTTEYEADPRAYDVILEEFCISKSFNLIFSLL